MRIEKDTVLHEGKWVNVRSKVFRDRFGMRKEWSYLERTAKREAVVVVPETRETGSLVLIRQFRIPFEADVVEFPAGLIDPGESPADTAQRELLEETGYSGAIRELGPAVSSSAGLTTERVHMAYMSVEERPSHATAHEGSELIDVFTLAPTEFENALEAWSTEGLIVDAKVYVHMKAVIR